MLAARRAAVILFMSDSWSFSDNDIGQNNDNSQSNDWILSGYTVLIERGLEPSLKKYQTIAAIHKVVFP